MLAPKKYKRKQKFVTKSTTNKELLANFKMTAIGESLDNFHIAYGEYSCILKDCISVKFNGISDKDIMEFEIIDTPEVSKYFDNMFYKIRKMIAKNLHENSKEIFAESYSMNEIMEIIKECIIKSEDKSMIYFILPKVKSGKIDIAQPSVYINGKYKNSVEVVDLLALMKDPAFSIQIKIIINRFVLGEISNIELYPYEIRLTEIQMNKPLIEKKTIEELDEASKFFQRD